MMNRSLWIALILAGGAAVMDRKRAAIDNRWTLFWSLSFFLLYCLPGGTAACREALCGMLLPFCLLYPFFLFRMIGAGDIKLLMALGAMFGTRGSGELLLTSFLLAAGYALLCFRKQGGARERFRYLLHYVQEYLQTGERKPYLCPEVPAQSRLHMALPIFAAVLLQCVRSLF